MAIIPKIALQVTSQQLKSVYQVMDFEMPPIPYSGAEAQKMKSFYSLLEVIKLKLAKKALSQKNKKKPFKLSLEFYEANCLHKTLIALPLPNDAQLLFNQLDQKLA